MINDEWETYENEDGTFMKKDKVILHTVRSQKYIDEHPTLEPEPQPPTLEEQLVEVRLTAEEIDTRTIGMQEIDAFTLDKSMILETRAEGMQEVDDFTLLLVNQMQTKVDELEQKILILEGQ